MRRILLAGLALPALIMPAMAADVAPLSKIPPPPVLSWTGFYIGANVGWAGAADTITNTGTYTGAGGFGTLLTVGAIPGALTSNNTGFIGGGQIGYNWQVWPDWVLGIEADFEGVDAKSSNALTFLGSPGFAGITTAYSRELELARHRPRQVRLPLVPQPAFLWHGRPCSRTEQDRLCRGVPDMPGCGQHIEYVRRLDPRRRRRMEICSRLERESRVPVCRFRPPQQHDIVRLLRQRHHTDKHGPRTRQHRARRRQLYVRLLIVDLQLLS